MRRLGMAPIGGGSRGERTRLRDQMQRLFNAHIQLAYEDKQVSASVNSPVASRTGFWWNERKPGELGVWDSKIELGGKFFHEIIHHPVPLNLNILKALKRSSLGIDFYLWLTYRTFTLKRPLRLSWASLYRQFGLSPARAGDKRTADDFRKDCLRELKKIQIAWPELNYATAHGALILQPSKPAVPPARLQFVEVALKPPSLTQNRLWRIQEDPGPPPGDVGEYPRVASMPSEGIPHKTPVIRGVFQDETPRLEDDFVDETPRHSYS